MVFELDNDLWVEVVTKISRICRLDLGRGGLLVGIGDSDGSGALTTSFCRWRWLGGLVIGGCGADVDGDGGHGTWSWWDVDISTYYLLRAFLEFTQTLLGIWPLTKSGSEKWSYVGLCRLSHEISQLFRCGLCKLF